MTQQDRQIKKVKLYRTLKFVFYCLGLPLFVLTTFLSSVKFIGHDPFTGNSQLAQQLGFWKDINILFTSPALYGVWIAFGIWLFIAIIHLILSKTVKNRRVRMFAVTAVTLVVMLGGMFVMDAVLSAKIDEYAKNAPSTVTVADYKTQLSYYRTISSYKHSSNMTENLIKQVSTLETVYNVEMEGVDKTGVAGSIGNKPVTYYNVISDEGVSGVDISFTTDPNTGFAKLNCDASGGNNVMAPGDGEITKDVEGKQVIRLAPNAKGELVINGTVYSHYFAQERNSVTGGAVYTWYTRDMMPTAWREGDPNAQIRNLTDGIYGKGLYNQNGMLSDGWIFSVENVLEILEDYYEAQEAIENGDEALYSNEAYATIYAEALQRRHDYYMRLTPGLDGELCDEWTSALYQQEADLMIGRFSLTRGELDELLAKIGALLGDNKLFDYIFFNNEGMFGDLDSVVNGALQGFLGGSLNVLFDQLKDGLPLSQFGVNEGTLKTISDILQLLTGKTYDFVDDLYVVLAYKGKTDCFGVTHDNLYLALVRGVASWKFTDDTTVPVTRKEDGKWYYEDGTEFITATSSGKTVDKDGSEVKYVVSAGSDAEHDIMLDIDFDDRIIGEEEIIDPDTGEHTYKYAFDFDTLSTFLNTALNNAIDKYVGGLDGGIVGTILNLVKTLNLLKTVTFNGTEYTGLVISGIEIPIINNKTNKVDIDINGILTNVVRTLYTYQSSVIKPVWEFFEDPIYSTVPGYENAPEVVAQRNYAKYHRALYTATVHGKLIGSVLIGDSLGTGKYASDLGLTDLASVQQLKSDMSYQPTFFPLYALRDMLAFFAGSVILVYFMSFVAAEKEEDYASGKLTARTRKEKKKHEAEVIAEFDALDVDNATEADALLNGDDKPVEESSVTSAPADQASLATDDEVEEVKPKKKRFGKKEKPVVEESDGLDDFGFDEEEEPPKKKGLFGKKKKKGEEDPDLPVDGNSDEEVL